MKTVRLLGGEIMPWKIVRKPKLRNRLCLWRVAGEKGCVSLGPGGSIGLWCQKGIK
jgi:hypothetical protein